MQCLIWCNLSPLDDLVGFDLLADELYPAGNDSDNNVNFTFCQLSEEWGSLAIKRMYYDKKDDSDTNKGVLMS